MVLNLRGLQQSFLLGLGGGIDSGICFSRCYQDSLAIKISCGAYRSLCFLPPVATERSGVSLSSGFGFLSDLPVISPSYSASYSASACPPERLARDQEHGPCRGRREERGQPDFLFRSRRSLSSAFRACCNQKKRPENLEDQHGSTPSL